MKALQSISSYVARSAPEVLGSAAAAVAPEISHLQVTCGISLRRLVARSAAPKGTILLLQGFPETVAVWKDVIADLVSDYDVHSFDWPGYGLSSRPAPEEFSYSPTDFSTILKAYVLASGIDCSRLTIYGTDIGSLPVLLAALEEPDIAKNIIVGDFAPFNRPQFMSENLQNLKSEPTASKARAYFNNAGTQIPANAHRIGSPPEAAMNIHPDVVKDMTEGWTDGKFSSGDAFYHYYSHFTRDEDYFEANLGKLATPVKVIWGELDHYINKGMGEELSQKLGVPLKVLPGIGHYPHAQAPELVAAEIRASI
ncbi:alpha/beta hydrolase [Rhizobium sp. BK376]|uniref:alpha/beta fold hydrolase n=1 Tax=Rhizobium sp. BK376 TaxID=2512149 RepID=UPI00104E3286|nr:alpha/beta hydrolase [Rhizobium sp. BK376]TCR76830.1 pimeloyl-ACP methyl ester carboxylesterase [Rhizobium sp. BK376]